MRGPVKELHREIAFGPRGYVKIQILKAWLNLTFTPTFEQIVKRKNLALIG